MVQATGSADGDDLTPVIVAAVAADVVRALQLSAVRAFVERLDLEGIVRTTHAATGRRYFSLGDSHGRTISSNNVSDTQ
jgi:hypothetical protein